MRLQIKAFTLLESLLTLGIVSLLCWLLAGSVHQAFGQVEETLFFSEFERVYQETQKMSIAKEERALLSIDHGGVHSPYQELPLPKGVEVVREKQLTFDPAGGNSSLTKIQFQTEKEVVTYQLAIGNGKIKKSTAPRSSLVRRTDCSSDVWCPHDPCAGRARGLTTAALRRVETRRSLASRKNGDPDQAGSIEHQSGRCPGGEVCQVHKGLS